MSAKPAHMPASSHAHWYRRRRRQRRRSARSCSWAVVSRNRLPALLTTASSAAGRLQASPPLVRGANKVAAHLCALAVAQRARASTTTAFSMAMACGKPVAEVWGPGRAARSTAQAASGLGEVDDNSRGEPRAQLRVRGWVGERYEAPAAPPSAYQRRAPPTPVDQGDCRVAALPCQHHTVHTALPASDPSRCTAHGTTLSATSLPAQGRSSRLRPSHHPF